MKAKINLLNFDYMDSAETDEISRNISVLIATPVGTCAGDRSYGIDQGFVGLPAPQAANALALELAQKIPEYEPRAAFSDVKYITGNDGTMTAYITITPAEVREIGELD